MRRDEVHRFVRLSDGAPVTWGVSTGELVRFHARPDGANGSVCTPSVKTMGKTLVPEDDVEDRSNDRRTCLSCQELVRRLPMRARC